jgi:uncharacterized protein with GYD domain
MPFFLTRFSDTPEARPELTKKPEDRLGVARAVVEKLGGKLHGFWYSFDAQDGFALIEALNCVSAAAFSVGISSAGPLRPAETTVLLTVEEAIEIFGKPKGMPYGLPGTGAAPSGGLNITQ